MNNDFFNILIIIFVVISIVSSLLKKREVPNKTEPKDADDNLKTDDDEIDMSKYPRYETEQNDNNDDILKEVETLFVRENSQSPQPGQRQTKIESQTIGKDQTSTTGSSSYQSSITKNQKLSDDLVSKGIEQIDSKIEQEARNFEKRLARQMDTEDVVTKGIKKKLNNPQSLKEFIAISEILGKPKALSR